jgi:hypothetical protein
MNKNNNPRKNDVNYFSRLIKNIIAASVVAIFIINANQYLKN